MLSAFDLFGFVSAGCVSASLSAVSHSHVVL